VQKREAFAREKGSFLPRCPHGVLPNVLAFQIQVACSIANNAVMRCGVNTLTTVDDERLLMSCRHAFLAPFNCWRKRSEQRLRLGRLLPSRRLCWDQIGSRGELGYDHCQSEFLLSRRNGACHVEKHWSSDMRPTGLPEACEVGMVPGACRLLRLKQNMRLKKKCVS
jgi:hypothetical protein